MNLFICIDDTDNLESIGTGELLENMCAAAEAQGLGLSGFVVRYQLLVDEAIPYTSHNSSMCCAFAADDRDALTAFCGEYLQQNAADGSDPGLCVLTDDPALDYSALLAFGRRAQTEVVTKRDAYEAAAAFGTDVTLSEHGGTGGGVIGALAGAGLRAGRAEGRVKGKLPPLPGRKTLTTQAFAELFGLQQIVDEGGAVVTEPRMLTFTQPTKAIYRDGKVTGVICLRDGVWMPLPKVKKEKH